MSIKICRIFFILFVTLAIFCSFQIMYAPCEAAEWNGAVKAYTIRIESGVYATVNKGGNEYPITGTATELAIDEVVAITFIKTVTNIPLEMKIGGGEFSEITTVAIEITFEMLQQGVYIQVIQTEYFTVTFMDGEDFITSQEVVANETAEVVPYSKELYIFEGFFEENEQDAFDFNTAITVDIILYAKFTENFYTLSYYIDNNLFISQKFEKNSIPEEYEAESKEHYTFGGWKDENEETYDFFVPLEENINLYGSYIIDTFEVIFNLDGGSAEGELNQIIANGADAVPPTEPAKEGYVFNRWEGEYTNITCNRQITAVYTAITYTVTYYVDDELEFTEMVNYKGMAAGYIPSGKEHYTFSGWSAEGGTLFDFSTIIDKDTTLYGYFIIDTYEVIFNLDGGTAEGEILQTVAYGEDAVLPTIPQKEGYAFKEWDKDHTNITGDRQITAVYTKNDYIIEYYLDGEKIYEITMVEHGAVISEFYNGYILQEGYEFLYWECGGAEYDKALPIKSNLSLIAKTQKIKYNIYFYLDGEEAEIIQKEYGALITEPAAPDCGEDCDFIGWFSDSEFTAKFVFHVEVKADIYIYGKKELKIFSVSYNLENGSVVYNNTVEISYGNTAEDPNFTAEGYTVSWYEDDEYSILYDFSKQIVSDTDIYGKATVNEYSITFDTSGYENLSVEGKKYFYGEEIDFPVIDYYGYTHNSYCDDKGESFSLTIMPAKNLILSPVFEPKTFTLNFSGGASLQGLYKNKVILPIAAILEHYYFEGWQNETGQILNGEYEIIGNMNFTAIYTEIQKITVHYDGNNTVAYYGSYIDLGDPVKENYKFMGWFTDENCTAAFDGKVISDSATLTVYPLWVKSFQTLFINSTGGNSEIRVNYGENTPELAGKERTGYNFCGWYFDENFTEEYIQKQIYEDTSVYGKFEKKKYNVKFVGFENKTISEQTVLYMEDAVCPEGSICLAEGYIFEGFDGEYTKVVSDLTLTAFYTKLYKVQYVDEKGALLEGGIPPVKQGFVFAGWQAEVSEGVIINTPIYIEENTEVSAENAETGASSVAGTSSSGDRGINTMDKILIAVSVISFAMFVITLTVSLKSKNAKDSEDSVKSKFN